MPRRPRFLTLRRFCAAALVAGCVLFMPVRLPAAPVDYLVDNWDTEDNLPSSTVTSIAQTPDGYLWVGTYNGLARFDGVRFVTFDPVNQPELGQARVQGLYLDVNGTLWINTYRGGLTSYRNGVFHNEWPNQQSYDLHTILVASTTNHVTFVSRYGRVLQRDLTPPGATWEVSPPLARAPAFECADGTGQLWFLSYDNHILQFSGGSFKLLADDGGLAGSKIYTLVADAQGTVWAGAENEIARWNGAQFVAMTPTNGDADIQPQLLFPLKSGAMWVLDGDRLRKMTGRSWTTEVPEWRGLLGPASGRTMGVHEDRAGGLWFNHYGNGLFHIAADDRTQRLTALGNSSGLPNDRVGAWFQSDDGGIWAGVDHGGLVRLRDRRFHVIGAADGLGAVTALSVCQDAGGGMWIGTAGGGLCRWDHGLLERFPVGNSTSANFVFAIALRPDGGAWLSAGEGEDLFQYRDGTVQRASWEVHGIKSMLTDHLGRVWMGTKYGIAFADGDVRRMLGTNSTGTLPAIRALVETADGKVWAGSDDGTLYQCEPDKLTAFRPSDSLREQPIYSMTADASGTIWAGTFQGGLLRFRNGQFSRITNGLPVDVISQILDDGHGRLWLGTHKGIYCVAKSVLNACADRPTNTVNYVTYGRHDGMASAECSDGYQPACWRAADGRLWFTTVRGGAVWVNPDEVTSRSPAPPVIIEEMRVDGEPVALTGRKIIVPPGRKQLDFRFTALSFDEVDKVRFRYRVGGLESDWVDLDRLRTLSLRNLPPGNYRLQVIACDSQGAWNDRGGGSPLAFVVQPFFYQTLTFRILAGALLVGGISLVVRRAATRKYRRKLALLQQQHAIERDRARIAKDIHDDIGAGLTQITLLTELARREPEQTAPNLERISDSARTLTKAMDEIVWAVDPQHDTFEGLMDYISAYAEDFLRVARIRCRMDFPLPLPVMRVDAEQRYNLFLALKESLNNIVKHSKATEVWLRLKVAEKGFTLSVEDNGQGLAAGAEIATGSGRISSGSGLGNLEQRLANIGGRCEIVSEPGRGTRVDMTLNVPGMTSPVMAIVRDENEG